MSQKVQGTPEIRRSVRIEERRLEETFASARGQRSSTATTSRRGGIVYVSTEDGVVRTRVEEVQPEITVVAPEPVFTGDPALEEPRMAPSTRLKYKQFRGNGKTDVDDWYGEFESTALANEENADSKHRIFQGLLKGEALKWYQDLEEEEKNDWEVLIPLFLRTFREAGGEARALGQLSKIYLKSDESVRKYGQRVKSLMQKLTDNIAPRIQVEWYMAGLPEEMGFQIRQTRPANLREAMESAQNYENSANLRTSVLKAEKRRERELEAARRNRRRDRDSDKSESDSEASSDGRNSDSGPSSPERRPEPSKKSQKAKELKIEKEKNAKLLQKVKKEDEESRKTLKGIQDTLEAIRVNLAEDRRPRRVVPVARSNVWCIRCGEAGHYASECQRRIAKNVQYVNPEDGVYYTYEEEETDEMEMNPVYQVQSGAGRGKTYIQPRPGVRPAVGPSSQMYVPPRNPNQTGFCFVCGSPDHYANVCPFRGTGQGAPLPLPCQNCGEYGHGPSHCPRPAIARPAFKPVEILPREQTGLNYGHTAGTEKPDK